MINLVKSNLANISGLFCIALWSMMAVFTFNTKSIPPLLFASLVFLFCFIGFVLKWIICKENIINNFKISKESFFALFTIIGIGNLIYYLGFRLAPPFVVNLLYNLWPTILVASVIIIENKKIKFTEIVGILFALIGLALIFINMFSSNIFNIKYVWGYLLGIVFALIASLGTFWMKKVNEKSTKIGSIYLYSAILFFAFHLFREQTIMPSGSVQWLSLFGLSFCITATTFWNYAITHNCNLRLLSSLCYFLPLFSILLLWLIMSETLNPNIISAAFFITAGAIMCNLKIRFKSCKE